MTDENEPRKTLTDRTQIYGNYIFDSPRYPG